MRIWRFVFLENYVFQHFKSFVGFPWQLFPQFPAYAILCHIFMSSLSEAWGIIGIWQKLLFYWLLYLNFVKFEHAVFVYASGQTDRQTNKHTDRIAPHPYRGRSKLLKAYYDSCIVCFLVTETLLHVGLLLNDRYSDAAVAAIDWRSISNRSIPESHVPNWIMRRATLICY